MKTPSKSWKARNVFIFQHFCFYEQLKFHAQLSWAWKMFYNLGPGRWNVDPGLGANLKKNPGDNYYAITTTVTTNAEKIEDLTWVLMFNWLY